MRHYAGSVAFDQSGRVLAVSCPRGNLITFWDGRTGRLIDQAEIADGCGVAPAEAPGTFVITGGRGDVVTIEAGQGGRTPMDVAGQTAWDNHLGIAPSREDVESPASARQS
jgi:hypothetical protein